MKSDEIDQFFELEKKIWALVGCEDVAYPGLEDARHFSFCIDNGDLLYGTPGGDYWGGELYGRAPGAVWKSEKYTIAVYDNGCGDRKCPVLFDNSKAVDREAFDEF